MASDWVLNDNANPLYLGLPGVRDVRTDAQYERPAKDHTGLDEAESWQPDAIMYDLLGRPVRRGYQGLVIQNGHKYPVY